MQLGPPGPDRQTTPNPRAPPARSTVPQSPPIYSINKLQAGPRQRIMVHLEVTGKENRALCITNRNRDKPAEALRNLDKGLTRHVRDWIHFLFLSMLEYSVSRAGPAASHRRNSKAGVALPCSNTLIKGSHIHPKVTAWTLYSSSLHL